MTNIPRYYDKTTDIKQYIQDKAKVLMQAYNNNPEYNNKDKFSFEKCQTIQLLDQEVAGNLKDRGNSDLNTVSPLP